MAADALAPYVARTTAAMILLYRICRSFSYLMNDFKYLCDINVEEWHKMWMYIYVPSEKFST